MFRVHIPTAAVLLCVMLCPVYSLGVCRAEVSAAAVDSQHQPKVCLGYNALYKRWGPLSSDEGADLHYCPDNYAFFGTVVPLGAQRAGRHISLLGYCCPLPAKDILLEDHLEEYEQCPDGYVATGSQAWQCRSEECQMLMRCTKINSERYQLGPAKTGIAWGIRGRYPWKEKKTIKRVELPIAVRWGLTRRGKIDRANEGCVGDPIGSLLAAKTSKRCKGFYFRQLQFRGRAGDPPAGTAVRMYPDCRDITDELDPEGVCIP